MKRLILALTVAVTILALVVFYLVRKTTQMERDTKPGFHLIAAASR